MYMQREIFEVSHGNICHMDNLYWHFNNVDWWLPRDTLHRSLPQSSRETFRRKTCIIDKHNYLQNVIQIAVCNQHSFPVRNTTTLWKHCLQYRHVVMLSLCHDYLLVPYQTGNLPSSLVFSINLCLEIKSWQTKSLLLLTLSWTLGISCATSFSKRRRSVY